VYKSVASLTKPVFLTLTNLINIGHYNKGKMAGVFYFTQDFEDFGTLGETES